MKRKELRLPGYDYSRAGGYFITFYTVGKQSVLGEAVGAASGVPRPTNMRIPRFVSLLKRYTNRKCGDALWQASYFDHIISDENDFLTRWNYIESNSARWAEDKYYTAQES